MAARTHYEVLGVAPDASSAAVREAYRRRAREHHPDRAGSAAGGGAAMPAVNEAYRVLSDPGRRAMYDAALRADGAAQPPTPAPDVDAPPDRFPTPANWHGPARVPWRGLLVAGIVASIGVVALAQFTDPGEDPGPDGILRVGDCVQIEPNNDAREVSCTGEGDFVVQVLVPFDATCPGGTQPHRDWQGMGVACVEPPETG